MNRYLRLGKDLKSFNELLVQTFYNGLQQPMKISIHATTRGDLMRKLIKEAKALLEKMASNNYHWASDHENLRK